MRIGRARGEARLDGARYASLARQGRLAFEGAVSASLRLFQAPARRAAERQSGLRFALEQAHIGMLPEAFLAFTWGSALATGLVLLLGSLAFVALVDPGPALTAALLVLPAMGGATVYVGLATFPDYRAGERRRAIDKDLPYAANYIAAMASAGVVPSVLLRDLARERAYGEVSREAAWIVRDMDLLGVDLLTALQQGIARSPSRRFQEFLQGAKTTVLSGGDLKAYFSAKADQYMVENRRVQKEFLESLGVMAESYVTVVIAGPLFMVVMLSIMLVVGRSARSSELFLFFLVFIMLPVAHTGFAWIVKNLTPEG